MTTAMVVSGSAQASAMPVAVNVRCGKGTKLVQHFTGSMCARDVKAQLKAGGARGKDLAAGVRAVLTGERDLRGQLGVAWVQATIQSGFIPDKGEIGKNGACLRFVKVVEPKAAAPVVVKPADYVAGLSEEAKVELRKMLGV